MPLGISVAPEEFECKLQQRIGDLKGIEILRDDILAVGYGDTLDEANRNQEESLLKLLDRARDVNLKFNGKKINLRKNEVGFMGHVLTSSGLKPDPDKVKPLS